MIHTSIRISCGNSKNVLISPQCESIMKIFYECLMLIIVIGASKIMLLLYQAKL